MTFKPKRYCKHGHDTWECGRFSSGGCVICGRVSGNTQPLGESNCIHLDPEPLRSLVNTGDAAWAWMEYRGCTEIAARRAAQRLFHNPWLTQDTADRWCIALGTHLSLVYPELYPELYEEAI